MAVSKGKIQHVVPKSGQRRPRYRSSLVAGTVAFFDLPFPKPPERTVMVRADAAMRVIHPFGRDFKEPLQVVHDVYQPADAQMAIFNLLSQETDIAVRTQHSMETRCDTAMRVTHRVNCRGDTAQRIGNRLGASADLKQTIYIVLINESHVITT